MSKISPCLWFNGEAEEAANLYISLLPDSRIENVQRNIVTLQYVIRSPTPPCRVLPTGCGPAVPLTNRSAIQPLVMR